MGVTDCIVKPRRTGRTPDKEITQRDQHIVEVAEYLWMEHGSLNVTLADISQEAHVATRTLYAHFGGKDGIAHAILSRMVGHIDSLLDTAVLGSRLSDCLVALAELLLWIQINPVWKELRLYASARRLPKFELMIYRASMIPLRCAIHQQLRCLPLKQGCLELSAEILTDMFIGAVVATAHHDLSVGTPVALLKVNTFDLAKNQVSRFLSIVSDLREH